MEFDQSLPIDAVLPELTAALGARNVAVLVAPPGAGKSTRVPLVLANEPWASRKKIIVLEPRRLAARAAATRMAMTLGEQVGETVGYRVRFGSRISRATRIEVVTEGVFTRRVLDDPGLDGIAALLFDEFHERSLDADLGLALARDVQSGLREDLRLLVMSATLDGARVARLLGDAPVIESRGRAFAVETRYLGRDARAPIERQVVDAILQSIRAEAGSVLAFLPGAAEIRRAETQLRERLVPALSRDHSRLGIRNGPGSSPGQVDIVALHGALDAQAQDRAIAPAPPGRRKIVLATSIAETSLTIEGVRIVIDCGLARVPRYEPDVGLTRLETVRVSRAAADQRRGRAGRTEPGVCYRLWEAPQTASLEPANRPEILAADLSGFVLDLAHWGVRDPAALDFLDPPPLAAVTEAKALLAELGAVDAHGRITQTGKDLRQLPLPPRLARMVVDAAAAGEAARAADIAVVLTERGLGGGDVDLAHRLEAFHRDRSQRASEARGVARRWTEMTRANANASPAEPHVASAASRDAGFGAILALAYPDRIAKNRGAEASFLLANGRGARLDAASRLAREPFLAVAEVAGSAAQGRIVLAAALSLAEIEAGQARRIETREEMVFDSATASLRARRVRRLGALTLAEQPMTIVPNEDSARLLAQGIARLGIERLPWTKALRQWRDRLMFLRGAQGHEPDAEDQEPDVGPQQPDAERQQADAEGQERKRNSEWPDLSDAALAGASDWLVGLAAGKRALAEITAQDLGDALAALLPWRLRRRLELEAPTHFVAPSGSAVPIDYAAEAGPRLAIRVQELFGLDRHPTVAAGRAPLVLELLSPAHRPVQVTRDLPSFWRGSYASVKAEMKGRYPRHPWPDDPLAAPPTRRAKPRGT